MTSSSLVIMAGTYLYKNTKSVFIGGRKMAEALSQDSSPAELQMHDDGNVLRVKTLFSCSIYLRSVNPYTGTHHKIWKRSNTI